MTPALTTREADPDTLDGLLALMGVSDEQDGDATLPLPSCTIGRNDQAPALDRERLIAQSLADLSADGAGPFRPAGMTPSQADLFNLFYARAPRTSLAGNRRWTWCLDGTSRRMRSAVELSSPAGSFVVTLAGDCRLQDDWDLDWRPHTGDARLLAWTLYYEPLIEHLSATLGLALEPAAVLDMLEDTDARTRIDFVLDDGTPRTLLRGSLYLPSGATTDLFAALNGAPVALEQATSVPIRFAVRVAACLASPREIAGLSPGDAIAIGSANLVADSATVMLASGTSGPGMAATISRGGHAVTLAATVRGRASHSSLNDGPTAMPLSNDVSTSSPGEAGGLDLSDLPVTLSFEAGTLQITVAELATLNPGTVLVLDRKVADAQVMVRANGRPLAQGEFVTINDFLAVRIVRTLAHGPE